MELKKGRYERLPVPGVGGQAPGITTVYRNELIPGSVTRVAHAALTWEPLTLINSWAHFGSGPQPAITIDNEGTVWMRGTINGNTSGTQFALVDAKYAPTPSGVANLHVVCGASTSTDHHGLVRVGGETGGVGLGTLVVFFPGTLNFIALDGVSWRREVLAV